MVKYCQECGNASYDSAPKCGNCGAILPPKSEANSRPPKLDGKFKQTKVITSTNDSIFSGKSSSFGKDLSGKLSNFDLSRFSNTSKDKKEKKAVPKKEKKVEPKEVKKEEAGGSTINFRKIGIIAIIVLIILLIAGIGLNGIQNQTTNEVKHYTDGVISFDYSGNWSMYNNTNENSNSSDIAFKTKDNTLIGFTTIQSNEITYDKILSDVNATAQSLNGELLEYQNVDIGGVPSLEMTISTADQGYSRYICTLRDGVYYSFVINNGKSSNSDISALNTTEIQNMINSIGFPTVDYGEYNDDIA